ncbi:hypothetical protein NDU88_008176 [Pleurodeles waltl]|uniref:Uncharacterized protein n=1 Tax=Pleurodeles waltl TaxID=8319 RepID=A0AAV7N7I7_PLEWA|nr:hypothetical protein NDU88_008176 [Pleurodeles waltl]
MLCRVACPLPENGRCFRLRKQEKVSHAEVSWAMDRFPNRSVQEGGHPSEVKPDIRSQLHLQEYYTPFIVLPQSLETVIPTKIARILQAALQ